jgi:hypothetical protein
MRAITVVLGLAVVLTLAAFLGQGAARGCDRGGGQFKGPLAYNQFAGHSSMAGKFARPNTNGSAAKPMSVKSVSANSAAGKPMAAKPMSAKQFRSMK